MEAVKKRRILLLLCWLAYVVAYVGRYSYNSNINLIIEDFSVDKKTAGLVQSAFFFSYGAGQVINGLLCKRYNKKYVLSAAMVISAAINLTLFIGVPFYLFKYLWFVNGAAQSVLWSSLILILGENLPENEIKRAVLVMSTTVAFGTFAAYGASAVFAVWGAYRFSFLTGAIALFTVGAAWFVLYEKVSEKKIYKEPSANVDSVKNPANLGLSIWITVILLAVFAIANNVIKDGLTIWVPNILKDGYGLSDSLSIFLTLFLPVVAVFGATVAVALNKKIKSFISLSGVLFMFSAAAVVGVLLLLKTPYWIAVLICFAVTSCTMASINSVITSMAPLYMRDKISPGLLSGVLDGFCYVGSTISSYGLGAIADASGWNSVFVLFLALTVGCTLISAIYFIVTRFRARSHC